MVRVLHVELVVVERGQGTYDTGHHRHRVSVVVKARDEVVEALVNHGVIRQLVTELIQLVLGGQFAEQQQVSHLHEGALFRQLLDRVAAVAENPLVAVDEGDLAGAAGRCRVPRVVGEIVEGRRLRLDVQSGFTLGTLDDRQFHLFAGSLVDDYNVLAGH